MLDGKIFLGDRHARNLHGHTWTMHIPVIIVMDDSDAIQKHQLNRGLPIEYTQRKNTQRTIVFVQ